jgi:hypothetical protein
MMFPKAVALSDGFDWLKVNSMLAGSLSNFGCVTVRPRREFDML